MAINQSQISEIRRTALSDSPVTHSSVQALCFDLSRKSLSIVFMHTIVSNMKIFMEGTEVASVRK
jgi:competence transcription factor ComK